MVVLLIGLLAALDGNRVGRKHQCAGEQIKIKSRDFRQVRLGVIGDHQPSSDVVSDLSGLRVASRLLV